MGVGVRLGDGVGVGVGHGLGVSVGVSVGVLVEVGGIVARTVAVQVEIGVPVAVGVGPVVGIPHPASDPTANKPIHTNITHGCPRHLRFLSGTIGAIANGSTDSHTPNIGSK